MGECSSHVELRGISRCHRWVSEVRNLKQGVEDRNDEMVFKFKSYRSKILLFVGPEKM